MGRWIVAIVCVALMGVSAWWFAGRATEEPTGEENKEDRRQSQWNAELVLLRPGVVVKQPAVMPKPKGLTLSPERYPRASGSTSAEPLGVWVACRLLGRECSWPTLDGRLAAAVHRPPVEIRLTPQLPSADGGKVYDSELHKKTYHTGTHGAYVQLIEGNADLVYECRRPSVDEKAMMKEKKVELDIRPIARDAFVFLRHKDNPVENLTLDQVKAIYTADKDGKATLGNWKALGGPEADIHAYIRNRNSGSQETMMSLVMTDRTIVRGPNMTGFSMVGPYNNLHQDKHGIGYTFYYYQRYMSPRTPVGRMHKMKTQQSVEKRAEPPVKMFAIDGVRPSSQTIANGRYPLVTDVYVVTRKDLPADHPAASLRDWLQTPEGQAVIAETGYVPLPGKKEK